MYEDRYAYSNALRQLEEDYHANLDYGRFKPAVFPWAQLNILLLVIAINTTPTVTPRYSRQVCLVFFAGITAASVWSLLRYRSLGIAGSIGVGLNAFMVVVFAFNFLVLRSPKHIKRIKLSPEDFQSQKHPRRANTNAKDPWTWESIPNHPWSRLWWILDLIACLRALKWSWNRGNPNFPSHGSVEQDANFLRRHLVRFACTYLALDILKCIMIADPHFLGSINCAPPPHLEFLPPLALHAYRVVLAAAGVGLAVPCYGSAWALIQVYVLGPGLLGLNGLPCMYPALYGSIEAVLTRGLKGFWGQTWHQIFRPHFTSIGDAVAEASIAKSSFNGGCHWNSIIRLVAVFIVSGMLHACASFTLLGPSKPFVSFLCFAVQPLGILLQTGASQLIVQIVPRVAELPSLRRFMNLAFTLLWLWATFAPLANDFSRGGMWLLEPIPISVTRGIGLSSQDRRWFPLTGIPTPPS